MLMAKARYYKADGKKGRARDLPAELFDGAVNEAVLHQVVKAYLANQRQGTAAAKNRSAVSGGSRKPWRQKGTGRARQGTTRAPQWTGGGMAFPPQPHSWRQKVTRKTKALARQSAFTARAAEDRVVLIDPLGYEAPKTRNLVGFLKEIEAEGKVLLLTDGVSENVLLSARNVPGIEVRAFGTESVYDILWARTVVIERTALDRVGATVEEVVAEPAAEEPVAEAPPQVDEPQVEADTAEAAEENTDA